MTAELHRMVASRLRGDRQRYTDVRRAVVTALADAKGPLTISQILELDSELAQSSVYRNLVVLERAGAIRKVVSTDEWARYELAEDLTGHHHHLICSSCGEVSDFTLTPELEASIDAAFGRVARRHRFRLEQHRLDLVGLCRSCS